MMQHITYYSLTFLTYLLMSVSPAQAAFDDAGTDYTDQLVDHWFDSGPALKPLILADLLTCLVNAAGVGKDALVNTTYKAIVDFEKCASKVGGGKPNVIEMTVRSSKLDNNSLTPQNVDLWLQFPTDEIDKSKGQMVIQFKQALSQVVSTPRALTDTPYGAFTMTWRGANHTEEAPTNEGSVSFTPSGDHTDYKHFTRNTTGITFINGFVMNDLSSGHARSGSDHPGYATENYLVKYATWKDKLTVNVQEEGEDIVCTDETAVTNFVYDYNLYDEGTGAVKNLSGPFSGTYLNAGETKLMHAGPWGIWFDDLEDTHWFSHTTITHENGTPYTGITYEPNDDGQYVTGSDADGALTFAACSINEGGNCQANDGFSVHIPGFTFDPPLVFEFSTQESPAQGHMLSDSILTYLGQKSFYGILWLCQIGESFEIQDGTGSCGLDLKPSAIEDGTVFIDTLGERWVSKAVTKESSLAVADSSVCGNAGLADVASMPSGYPAFSTTFLTPVTITWADSEAAALKNAPLRVEIGPNGENGYLIPE